MRILGISAFYHDSAAALVEDGRILAAAQEERFSREKGDAGFPVRAVNYCLENAGQKSAALDAVVYYDKPVITFERLLSSYLHRAPHGLRSFLKSMPLWLRMKLWMEDVIGKNIPVEAEVLFSRHHHSHAASAFFPSPFERAAIVTIDGVGEWDTTAIGVGNGCGLDLLRSIHFPHSLGLLYSAFTYYCGFRVNSGEYKLMGLAPYGKPCFVDLIRSELIDIRSDGSFTLNERYFNYISGLKMISRRFERLFGRPVRVPDTEPEQFYMDIAASIQHVLEEAVLAVARHAGDLTGEKKLCLGGGVALNSVANARIKEESGFDEVWIQPAAGDAGGALGAALYAYHALFDGKRLHLERLRGNVAGETEEHLALPPPPDGMEGAYLGPGFSDEEAASELTALGASFNRLTDDDLLKTVAKDIASGEVVGWFQGRMEFGPRALGNRSILADSRDPGMKAVLNSKIKYRESFRPFAPSVAAEWAGDWFGLDRHSQYMLLVCPVKEQRRRSSSGIPGDGDDEPVVSLPGIPAVTHVDNSARVQTVHPSVNPRFYALIMAFYRMTGCPVVINTSFNVRGEPIVCRPAEAYRCFIKTGMDALAVGNLYMRKQDQPAFIERNEGGRQ